MIKLPLTRVAAFFAGTRLPKNWPTLLAAVITGAIAFAVSMHWITAEQAAAAGLLMVPIVKFVHGMEPPGGPPSAGAAVGIVLALVLSGCAGSLESARGPSARLGASVELSGRCASLDSRHRDWGSVAQGAAVLAGGSGLATLPLDGREGAQLAIGITGAAAAVVAAVAVAQAGGAAESFARECSR